LATDPTEILASDKYPRGTAYHEAGHAVVAWSLGLPVRAVRVSDDDASGVADIGSADHLSLIEQIAICSAGMAAVDVFDCPTHELASFNDNLLIFHLLEANGISEDGQGPKLRQEGYNCARTRLETHKSKLIKLAERLVQCGHVGASEILHLMDDEA
jgi:hypothetical protein